MELESTDQNVSLPRRALGSASGAAAASCVPRLISGTTVGLIVVAPLVAGGCHPVGRFVLSLLICLTTLLWVWSGPRRRRLCLTGVEWLMAAAAGLMVLQLMPLPQAWFAQLAPALAARLPIWTSAAVPTIELGSWSCVTAHPAVTRSGLAMFTGYCLLFLVTAHSTRHVSAVRRLLRGIAAAVVALAAVRLLLPLLGAARPELGMGPAGLTQLLVLGAAPLVWWMLDLFGSRRRIATLPAAVTLMGTVRALGSNARRTYRAGLLLLLILILLVIASVRTAPTRLEASRTTGGPALLDRPSSSVQMREAVLASIRHSPLLGVGVGAHRDVCPTYLAAPYDGQVTYTASSYLHILEEAGVVGLSLLIVTMALVGNWCRVALVHAVSRELRVLALVVTVSLLASAVHAAVQATSALPASMILTIILAAAAWRLSQLAAAQPVRAYRHMPRPLWVGGAVGVTVLCAVVLAIGLGPARAVRHWARLNQLALELQRSCAAAEGSTAEESAAVGPEATASQVAIISEMVPCVECILNVNPQDARAHVRMAELSLRQFALTQRSRPEQLSLPEVRDAALHYQFTSLGAQRRWLDRATAGHRLLLERAFRHARRAVQLSPLQAEPYVYLAQVGFVNGDGRCAKWAYLHQALRVRPDHDAVLIVAGSEWLAEGHLQQATDCWRPVFARQPRYQHHIITALAPQMSAHDFLTAFQPDTRGASALFQQYRRMGYLPQATITARHYLASWQHSTAGQERPVTAQAWLATATVQQYLGDEPAALASLRSAIACDSNHYAVRQQLGRALLRQQAYAEARQHLQWCLARQPRDRSVEEDLQTATRADTAPWLR